MYTLLVILQWKPAYNVINFFRYMEVPFNTTTLRMDKQDALSGL